MYRLQRCFIVGMQDVRSLVMAPCAIAGVLVMASPMPACALAASDASLVDLSLEELANLQITSVSRRAQRISDAAASVYVIPAEAIRRSGASSLPEALRLAPNLQIAQIDANQYAITARGFNNAIGNKLLVLIDGRTVYTTADLRYGRRFRPAWMAAVIGRNLLGRSHAEFGAAAGRSEIPRSLLVQVAWQQ